MYIEGYSQNPFPFKIGDHLIDEYGDECILEHADFLYCSFLWLTGVVARDGDGRLTEETSYVHRYFKRKAGQQQEKERALLFHVPDTDFDAIAVEAAMVWVREQVDRCTTQQDEIGGISAYTLLKVIHDRYMDALGEPAWKMPPLERRL